MQFELDPFNGVIIQTDVIPEDAGAFHQSLQDIVTFARREAKNIVWLTLSIRQSHLVAMATDLGFVFHNCQEDELTLILKAPTTEFVPFIPTHTIGAGAIVTNGAGQILVIREQGMTGFKLPGGHVELGERIEEAVVREVWEETGVEADFQSIVGFTTRHPFRFGKSNLYFVCRLAPTSETIDIQDTDEIAEARWVDWHTYIADPTHSPFNRQMVAQLSQADGLKPFEPSHNTGPFRKHETFFADGE
ncbi:NUDIX hydrolase [Marinobacter bohaiensis]|uniref:NUDIX hydrolase n=1 Tax=Marinobacter bohaiensis TaxID=2201898 RepID=UPI000DAC1CF5|nr:NUDIX domain-containing protein [Marinobacter bohaiensis]